jgi:hypothetical protein
VSGASIVQFEVSAHTLPIALGRHRHTSDAISLDTGASIYLPSHDAFGTPDSKGTVYITASGITAAEKAADSLKKIFQKHEDKSSLVSRAIVVPVRKLEYLYTRRRAQLEKLMHKNGKWCIKVPSLCQIKL